MVNLNDTKHVPLESEPDSEPEETDSFVPPEEVAMQDAENPSEDVVEKHEKPAKPAPPNKFKAFFAGYWGKKKWTLPLTLLVILGILLTIPLTRNEALGLFLKSRVSVHVVDSKTKKPVSSAQVVLSGKSFKTDASGNAAGNVNLGRGNLNVTKQYYKSAAQSVTVTFSKQHNSFTLALTATGRQVPITIINKITGKPLANAEIKVLNTEAKTDKKGMATIVLPTSAATQKAAVTLGGYNSLAGSVTVTDQVLAANTFSLTPSGTLYFLSKRTGTINVMKSDLDGSNAKVVLAGTGNEDDSDTILLASQDWKYLALKSRRDDASKPASLYLIDTTKADKLTTIDNGDVQFTLSGWSGHNFIYSLLRNTVNIWESNRQSLKTFNADSAQLSTIDSTTAEGTGGGYDYSYQLINGVTILDNTVAYVKTWNQGYFSTSLTGKQHEIDTVAANGQGKKTVKTFDARDVSYISTTGYSPSEVYFDVSLRDGTATQHYEIEDGVFKTSSDADAQKADQESATYLSSPNNNKTFWYEARDGKNTLFVGDKDGKNGQEIGTLTEFIPYGWCGEDYLLVSKNSSELYIFGVAGSQDNAQPVKITDYHKPAYDFSGYGKGYGGF